MTKKNFNKGINAFFREEELVESEARELDQDNRKEQKRTTVLLEIDMLEKLKALAYWERSTVKNILTRSLEQLFSAKGDDYINQAVENYNKNQNELSK